MGSKKDEKQGLSTGRGHREVDPFLLSLVDMANVGAISINITLNVDGGVISGRLIGIREYFCLFAKEIRESSALGPGPADANLEEFARALEMGADVDEGPENDSAEPTSPTIHLKGARIITGGVSESIQGHVLWRGRLSEVAGFCLGALVQG
jgi:hypothetical protein